RIEGNKIAISDYDEQISKVETEIQKLPSTERQLINIEREFSINDQIYTFLLEKRAEAGITKASNTADHQILDIAQPRNSVTIKPGTTMNYMIAMVSGVGIPLALLLLIDFFNTKINDRKYIENKLKVPVLGNIGHNEKGTELPINENPRSSLAESFRVLRTNLQYIFREPDQDSRVIAISSAVSGEGKTFTSVNLACILALAGNKTLLVSLDLRRPKIHKIFNLDNAEGVSTFLINKSNYENVITPTNINNLSVATSGPIPPNPSELLSSNKMKEFIKRSNENFDYVILDTPPIAIVTDTLTLKDSIDIFVFVIRHSYSDKQVIDLANDIKQKQMIKNVGVVINDIQIKGYYGYSYRYGYGYGYGYSYNLADSYYEEESRDNSLLTKIRKSIKSKLKS
ncbi:MAG: polysaccharide biosynthesis tyrosine autokinase, partial [Bacteroidales bacterium]|nr:polysaccharide biosynthesis tyrosine autokinase [Bacteroidales bacterium]